MMEFNALVKKISQQYQRKLPFAIYSKPDETKLTAYLQKDNTLHRVKDLSDDGYIMAPFDFKGIAQYIPESESEMFYCDFPLDELDLSTVVNPDDQSDKDLYIALVNKTIDAIGKNGMTKVVTSRYKEFDLVDFSIENLVLRILSSYPSAYRYIWYHPETGIWCGATPEILLEVSGESFKTMALAGTQLYKDEPIVWGKKELHEQQVVTDDILDTLEGATSSIEVSEVKTQRAGSLLHLKTDIIGVFKEGKTNMATIANKLHPTPAIGGSPQKASQEFILDNEGYSREFYTGFFGAISNNATTAAFMVNLRSMKITDNTARVFVGGGITLCSIAEDEWQETQNKMQTMLQVLKPML